ncbi:MAG: DUF1566 domain-containing protein [Deltaproteobacteria bacterium]|nr:DUF1566 domain-containing protein [Deltaproteobacteria bacterium]
MGVRAATFALLLSACFIAGKSSQVEEEANPEKVAEQIAQEPEPARYAVGGTLTGAGSAITLQNQGEHLTLSADGAFQFATKRTSGTAYAITILTLPSAPPQTCTVANGTGTIGSADVGDIAVHCGCHAGQVRCAASTELPETCDDQGAWQSQAACMAPTPACLFGGCVSCEPGDALCVGQTPRVCNGDGVFVNTSACAGDLPVCLGGQCVACTPDAIGCHNGIPAICIADGSWVDQPACTAGDVCFQGACVDCLEGTKSCNVNVPRTCNASNLWVNGAACTAGTPLCLAGNCVACTPAEEGCTAGETPRVCNDQGAWENQSACGGGTPICLNGDCVECTPTTHRCHPITPNTPQTCSAAGAWTDDATCGGGTPLCYNGGCVECTPGVPLACNGLTPRSCNGSGAIVNGAACNNNTQTCSTSGCVCKPSRFSAAGGIVTDNYGTVYWQETSPTLAPNPDWNASNTYCENLSLGGFTDWRLPTIAEMRELSTCWTTYLHSQKWTSTIYGVHPSGWNIYWHGGYGTGPYFEGQSGANYTAYGPRCVRTK